MPETSLVHEMSLQDIEYDALMADRLFKSHKEKVRYVNVRHEITDTDDKLLQGKKQAIGVTTYYKILKSARAKLLDRLSVIAKHFTTEFVTDFSMVEQEHAKLYKIAQEALNNGNLKMYHMLIKDWFDYMPYVTAMREACKYAHQEHMGIRPLEEIQIDVSLRPKPTLHAYST